MTVFRTQLAYRRRPTRVVRVGDVPIGGGEPIRIQSMLTANTWDVDPVMAEMRELVEAGCEIVRLTVPTRRDLEALPEIRRRMAAEGLDVPLVADIHFNPRLALGVVPHVEKVRINPGNYVDQKRFKVREYSDAEYAAELERVEQALLPLIDALKRHGRALRVGVNHGSLSDRVINRYGDTPEGMVESAMEYLRVLGRHGFHDTIVSMKASNPRVVIQAYRLLAVRMAVEGMDYPFHVGVTEAGGGADGRIKSAVGIGSLLLDGLGDTVRVSLTESAANEVPAARELAAAVELLRAEARTWPEVDFRAGIDFERRATDPLPVGQREGRPVAVGGEEPVGFLALADAEISLPRLAGETFDAVLWPPADDTGDGAGSEGDAAAPLRPVRPAAARGGARPVVVRLGEDEVDGEALRGMLERAGEFRGGVVLLVEGRHLLYPVRRLAGLLDERGVRWPIAVRLPAIAEGELPLAIAGEVGNLAGDGLIDAVASPTDRNDAPAVDFAQSLLQAARLRTYKPEYIACPSCGRTLFDLEETTERVRRATQHLKGVKIAVMGCIVNGPGEMADADFGYVGGAPGKIALYKGHHLVERGVPTEQAVDRLVALIKDAGRWTDPPEQP